MSREISVSDVQKIIMDLKAYAHSTCPDWAVDMVLSMSDMLEHILVERERGDHG